MQQLHLRLQRRVVMMLMLMLMRALARRQLAGLLLLQVEVIRRSAQRAEDSVDHSCNVTNTRTSHVYLYDTALPSASCSRMRQSTTYKIHCCGTHHSMTTIMLYPQCPVPSAQCPVPSGLRHHAQISKARRLSQSSVAMGTPA